MKTWSDDEDGTLRWWNANVSSAADESGTAAEPTEFELNAIRNDTVRPEGLARGG
ncbi:MAG: hypothetical protein R3C20_14990 [Planctomycetaceae bacterium]